MPRPKMSGPGLWRGRVWFSLSCRLEDNFRTELQSASPVCSGRREEVARNQIVVYATPLGVVEDIERLGTKFKSSCFCEPEMLEKSHVEIRSPRVAQAVTTGVPEGEPRGICIGRWIVQKGRSAITSA